MTLLLFLPGPAAHAGSWTYAITGDNTGTSYTDNGNPGYVPSFSPASSGNGSNISIPGYNITRQENGGSGSGCSITVIGHVQVTFTWVPAAGLTMTTDPPPPNVLVLETANTGWSASAGDSQHSGTFGGSASDGLGDAEVDLPSQQTSSSGTGYSDTPSNYDPNSLIGEHLTSFPASSGTVTIPQRTFKSTATTTISNWYYGASAGFGSYTAAIHPQPYDYHQTLGQDNGDGTISFKYAWLSTTGNVPDLTSCYLHERVTYPGGNPYYPPLPFMVPSPGYANPTVYPGTLQNGIAM
ncbi:MAG: hypothetical protein M3Y13_01170, partial [Armatimonadota bacterium]|nr:hypothetical protein [Armatimonadota bacterium]